MPPVQVEWYSKKCDEKLWTNPEVPGSSRTRAENSNPSDPAIADAGDGWPLTSAVAVVTQYKTRSNLPHTVNYLKSISTAIVQVMLSQ
jgi:hypothetical protein